MPITQEDLPLECFYRWERERADRRFLTQPMADRTVRHWTWAEAASETRRMAAYLKAQHWEPGSRVAILSKNCAWWILSDLAIWMAGHVSVPIYPSLRAHSIRHILEHSGAKACFAGAMDDAEAAELESMPELHWIEFPTAREGAGARWQSIIESNAPMAESPVRAAGELATIIYTSGTTGTPKGVMHCFGGLAHNAMALTHLLKLGGHQRVLSYLPLAHIVERAGVEMNALRSGWHLFFAQSVETFLEDLHRARPTLFISVPRLLLKFQQGVFSKMPKEKLDRLLRIPAVNLFVKRRILRELGLDTVHHAASGAAPLPAEMLLWYRNLGLALVEGYGMTETMITHLPRPESVRPGFVGTPLEGVENKLTAEGELLVRSPMNMLGYYRDPELTKAAFTEDGFFRTGDIAFLDVDGQLKIIGRIKEQFKTSKGKYVSPAPIENRLLEHADVEGCCVLGRGQASPFAIISISEEARRRCADPKARQALEESLGHKMDEINAELETFEQLSMIVIADGTWTVANGFLTPTLKLRRSVLEERYERLVEEWRAQNRHVVWEGTPAAAATAAPYREATEAEKSPRLNEVPPSQV